MSSAAPAGGHAGEEPPPPSTTRSTTSTCTAGTVEGHHRFAIRGYSRLRASLAVGEYVRSATFSIAGYDWAVVFYPRGVTHDDRGHAAVYVQLLTDCDFAAATFDLRFVRADSGKPLSVHPPLAAPKPFSTILRSSSTAMYGIKVEAMQMLEANYVRRDRLIIDCTVHVVGKPRVSAAAPLPVTDVPPPDLAAHLGRLLDLKSHADVTFDVQGVQFAAHRTVLAMRSAVFNAELFGPMRTTGDTIKVGDMQPAVFKVLLGYIYTDSLAAMDDLDVDEDNRRELARHLLVAADRYDMDRLKLMCGSMLARSLTAQTVASTMALAERHGCRGLREACVEFVIAMGMNDEVCTTSTSTTATVEGRHRFRVAGYSATKGAAPGHRVTSGTFTVGGFDWAIVFYPEGVTAADMDFVSVYLELKNAGGGEATARAFYDLRLIHPATGEPRSVRWLMDGSKSRVFSQAFPSWGHLRFMRRRELEEMGFVRDDRLTIECVINVVLDPVVTAGDAPELDSPPPSNILDHLAGLLDDKDTADVTFVVRGEEFAAHRAVLAMRSPVFKAALYGPMKESTDANAGRIAIDGIEPAVFRALLHFIYTDTTAAMDDLDDDDKAEMIVHLLEAADRYDVERLKLMCELMLCKSITVDTVAATLAVADQHHCQKLKEACVEFLATSKKMEGVMESQGYKKMKLSCPSFMVDLWEIIGRKMTSYSVIPNIYARNKD
uniref:Uncharacterized protein n=1 Tax=Oryza punctata TaxID=4537 RepID=A0A0E0LQW4_ORYPU